MILENIDYLDIENEKIIKNVDILIKDNLIAEIKKNKSEYPSKKLAIPALVNSHSHLGMAMLKNYADDMDLFDWLENKIWPIEAKLTPDDIYYSSLLSICEMIRSGVGTFCDMYFEMDRVCDATLESSLRGSLTRGLEDITGSGMQKIKELYDLYEKYDGRELLRVFPGPHAIYTCSKDYLKECIKAAKDMGNIVNIHISETKKEVCDCIKSYNMTPINYLMDLGFSELHTIAAHCTHITDDEIDLIRDKDFYPVYNPSSNLKLASGFTPVQKLLNKGIVMGIGTDGSSSNNNQNLLEEIHIGAVVNKAVEENPKAAPAIEMLKMGTVNGYKALGYENIGYIKEGYLADIAIINLDSNNLTPPNNLINALVYSINSCDVSDLLVNGKYIMKDEKILTLDEVHIRKMVNKNFNQLLKRL